MSLPVCKVRNTYTYLPGIWSVCVFGVVRIYQTRIISLNLPNYPKKRVILFSSVFS